MEEPPTVHIEPRFLTVNVGDPVSFRCVATGSPRPTIEWTGGRDGRLSPDAIINGGVLRFETASRAYEAEYTCIARNSAGEAQVRTILYVKGGELIVDLVVWSELLLVAVVKLQLHFCQTDILLWGECIKLLPTDLFVRC